MSKDTDVLLVGVGAMAVVEIIKTVVPWPLRPEFKLGLGWLLNLLGLTLSDGLHWKRLLWRPLAALGISILANEVRSCLDMASDNHKTDVMVKAQRPPRRAMAMSG